MSTKNYTYGDSAWGDLLTSYSGTAITYDTIGNPLNDGIRTYTWERGRRLASLTTGGSTWSQTYNNDGLRIGRTNGSSTYTYYYSGNDLRLMTKDNYLLFFILAPDGSPVTVTYKNTSTGSQNTYYYVLNPQGDVIALLNLAGNKVVEYTYDAWGNILTTTGSLASTLGAHNPFRYRGYIYDQETGLYYLRSRFYNPQTGRFINADEFTSTGQGFIGNNTFAYCSNNPVSRIDPQGTFWETAFDVVSLCASVVEVCANPGDIWAWAGLVGDAVDLIPFVTCVGESVRAANTTRKLINNADNVVDAAKAVYKGADAASDIKTATGTYEILYKSGKNYVGKGGFKRAINSASRNAAKYGDEVTSIMWKSSPNSMQAFMEEYALQSIHGVNNSDTYNLIWSPGKRIYESLFGK